MNTYLVPLYGYIAVTASDEKDAVTAATNLLNERGMNTNALFEKRHVINISTLSPSTLHMYKPFVLAKDNFATFRRK